MEMVEVRTAELIGPALDWAVAQCVGQKIELYGDHPHAVIGGRVEGRYQPSTAWSQGGPLLDKHCKSFGCAQDGRDGTWRAFGYGSGEAFDPARTMRLASGPSILVAACRAIVAAKLGATVQVPAELTR